MKILTRPGVELLHHSKDGAKEIEEAGRTCYRSEDKITKDSSGEFVRMLIDRGHTAMIEFASATFRVTTDRGVTHEIVRHRLASYAHESTRYCNYSKKKFGREITCVKPNSINEHDPGDGYKIWVSSCEQAEKAYFDLLDVGYLPQIARSVLPTCLATTIVMKTNFREWLHFLYLRHSPHAHPDMRAVAEEVGRLLIGVCPEVFEDYARKGLS